MDIPFLNNIRFIDKLLFTKHLSIFIKSGIPLSEGVKTLRDQSTNMPFRKILSKVLLELENGQTFESALAKFPNVFDPLYTGLVKVGEESGTLEKNLVYLADQLKKEYEFKKKVQGALLYPAIIFVTMTVVGGGISIFVLPKMTTLFESLHVDLPLSTKILLFIANMMKNYGILIFGVLFGLIIGFRLMINLPTIRPVWQNLLLRTPILGPFIQNVQLTSFCRNFGIMLKSGLPINSAIDTLKLSTSNLIFKDYINHLDKSLTKGNSIGDELQGPRYKYIPPIVAKMIGVGEKSGTLEDSLIYLGDFFEGEVDNASKNLSNVLEPVILLIIGGLVAFVAMAIISPIYELTGSVKR